MNESGPKTPCVRYRFGDADSEKKKTEQGGKKQQCDNRVEPQENLLITGFFGEQASDRME